MYSGVVEKALPSPHFHAVFFAEPDSFSERIVVFIGLDQPERGHPCVPVERAVVTVTGRYPGGVVGGTADVDPQINLADAVFGKFADDPFIFFERVVVFRPFVFENVIEKVDRC